MSLEQIIKLGATSAQQNNHITCVDGFKMSIIAGWDAYCIPRPKYPLKGGPYTHVEVGFPSEQPKPWDVWGAYCESPDSPTETVYGCVPVDVVRALVAAHGGEK